MRNTFIILFSLICGYIIWPYIAIFNLYITLKTADIVGVEKRVDWPSFKSNFQVDLDNLIKNKLKESAKKKGMKLEFDSLTLSKNISTKISTSEGLIYLFNKPNEFVLQIEKIFTSTLSPEQIITPIPSKKIFEPEGPNIPNLFNQIEYAFFIKPHSFQLNFHEGNSSFKMNWQLQGIFWKLTHLEISIKNI